MTKKKSLLGQTSKEVKSKIRNGWDKAFKKMTKNKDDKLLMGEIFPEKDKTALKSKTRRTKIGKDQ